MTTTGNGRRASPLVMVTAAELRALGEAVALLTRVPVPRRWLSGGAGRDHVVRGAVYFPLVGAGVGLAVAGTAVASALWLPALVAAVLAVSVDIALTGALHLDGLADSADGLAGRDRDHSLAIMRDHSVGVYGVAALGIDLLLKTATLVALVGPGLGVGALLVVAAYTLSRAAPLPLACLLDYARTQGTGLALVKGLTRRRAAFGVGLAIVLAAAPGGWAGSASWTVAGMLVTGAAFTLVVGLVARRRIGGVTGDVLGAAVELSMLGGLLVAAGGIS